MPKNIDLAEILRQNPQIDPERLNESIQLLETLRRSGVSRRSYELLTPFEGKRVEVVDSAAEESRTTNLTRI